MEYPTKGELKVSCARGGKATSGRLTRVREAAGDTDGETMSDAEIAKRLTERLGAHVSVEVAKKRVTRERERVNRTGKPVLWTGLDRA